ncbi:MAG: hypothetical protein ACRDPC_15305 [Solirubrobacteraceae bacterium]
MSPNGEHSPWEPPRPAVTLWKDPDERIDMASFPPRENEQAPAGAPRNRRIASGVLVVLAVVVLAVLIIVLV